MGSGCEGMFAPSAQSHFAEAALSPQESGSFVFTLLSCQVIGFGMSETVVSRTLAVQCAVGVFVQPHLPAERDRQTPGCHCPVMVSHLPEDVNLAVVTCLY